MRFADLIRRSALALLCFAGCSGTAFATDPAVLKAQLEALPGVVQVTQASSPIADTLFFRIDFSQPVDHADPSGPSFNQRMTLLHRGESLPMVLVTEGYGTPQSLRQSELAYYLQANQLRVEHRFFVPSSPDPQDWSKLDIAQAAADHHAITQSLKTIYAAKWVATGASKSGMASIYFRYFYPDDVAATVPYVAPSSHGVYDGRYVQFLSRVGPADCRARLRSFQELALSRRSSLVDSIPDYDYGYLGKDRAFEFMVLELPFAFWQYQSVALCPAIPVAELPTASCWTSSTPSSACRSTRTTRWSITPRTSTSPPPSWAAPAMTIAVSQACCIRARTCPRTIPLTSARRSTRARCPTSKSGCGPWASGCS